MTEVLLGNTDAEVSGRWMRRGKVLPIQHFAYLLAAVFQGVFWTWPTHSNFSILQASPYGFIDTRRSWVFESPSPKSFVYQQLCFCKERHQIISSPAASIAGAEPSKFAWQSGKWFSYQSWNSWDATSVFCKALR